MSGKDNLIPIQSRTTDEQREIQSKGGKASGKARREKKSIREGFNAILAAPVKDKEILNELKEAGVDKDAQGLLLLRIYKKAINGDMFAAKLLLTAIGEHDPAGLEISNAKLDFAYLKLEQDEKILESFESNTNFIEALRATVHDVWSDSDTEQGEEEATPECENINNNEQEEISE